MIKAVQCGRLCVIIDRSEVNADDPGQGTPAMVESGEWSATYDCALEEGELSNTRGDTLRLTEAELAWLDAMLETIDNFLYVIA